MGNTTITVQPDTLERFNELKAELGEAEPNVPEPSADGFLNSLMDTWEKVDDVGYGDIHNVENIGDALGHNEVAILASDEYTAESLRESIEAIAEGGDVPTADVKEALRQVIREEFEGVL